MNSNKKKHKLSPFKISRKRINSERKKKIIQGTFIVSINSGDVCDETSEDDNSWITETKTSMYSDSSADDVFLRNKSKIPGRENVILPTSEAQNCSDENEESLSPTETFRHSEKDDVWSLTHLGEDEICIRRSPKKGRKDDIVPTPEEQKYSDSETTTEEIVPAIYPISPFIEDLHHYSDVPLFSVNDYLNISNEVEKNSNVFKTDSEKHRKGILSSTRIGGPEIDQISPPQCEDRQDISTIPRNIQCSGEGKSQQDSGKKSTFSEKSVLSKEVSGETSLLNVERKKSLQASKRKRDVSKNNSNNQQEYSRSAKDMNILPSTNFSSMKKRRKVVPQISDGYLGETPKNGTVNKVPKRIEWQNGKLTAKSTKEKVLLKSKRDILVKLSTINEDVLEKFSPDKLVSNITADQSAEHTRITESGKSIRTSSSGFAGKSAATLRKEGNLSKKILETKIKNRKKNRPKSKVDEDSLKEKRVLVDPLSLSNENIMPTQSVEIDKASSISKEYTSKSVEAVIREDDTPKEICVGLRKSKKSAETKLMKQKNLRKRKEKEKSSKVTQLNTGPLSVSNENIMPTESVEINKAPSISKEYTSKSVEAVIRTDDTQKEICVGLRKSKKSAEAKLMKQKNLRKRKEKEKSSKVTQINVVTSSIDDFVVSSEYEESGTNSQRISKNAPEILNDEDSWNLRAVPKMRMERMEIEKSREEVSEDINLTPISTTTIEESIDYMDTSESEENGAASRNSENSTEKFLEEMGLYEIEHYVESESQVMQRKKDFKEVESKEETQVEKTLSERLREYKEYLKTIPICDLSLKKWRHKKKH